MLVEKYRPKKLDEIVGNRSIINKLKKFIDRFDYLPHLLFYGPQGTGKTSTAYALANEVKANVLEINASDQRGIDTIRTIILNFVRHAYNRRIVLLEEADGLTTDAQQSLRRIMEKFYKNCKFILCANDVNKIIKPIRSRCYEVPFKAIEKNDIIDRLKYIANNENIKVNNEILEYIAKRSEGDLRKAIIMLQMEDYPSILGW